MSEWNKSSNTARRLSEAMDSAGVTKAELSKKTGIDKGSITHYLTGKYEPKAKAIQKLSAVLGVSEMWLWGYDVPMQADSEESVLSEQLSRLSDGDLKRIADFMQIAGQLTDEQFEKVMSFVNFLLSEK